MKYHLLAYLGLITFVVIAGRLWLSERDGRILAEKDLKICLTSVEAQKNAEISSSKLIKELRLKIAKTEKVDCDCWNAPLPDAFVELQTKLK